jgi:hypothetical protein
MWGRRSKRRTRLEKQLSLAMLEDAMTRAEQQAQQQVQQQAETPVPDDAASEETAPAEQPSCPGPGPAPRPPAAAPRPAEPAALQPADVPVDNSSGPSGADPAPPKQRQPPATRREESTQHGSLG